MESRLVKTAFVAIAAAMVAGALLGFTITHRTSSEPNVTGQWEVHRGKAIDRLTLLDKAGVLTGEIQQDAEYGNGSGDVHGTRVGDKINWSYEAQPMGKVNYSMNGTLNGAAMSGTYNVLGDFSALAPTPTNEVNLWTAQRR